MVGVEKYVTSFRMQTMLCPEKKGKQGYRMRKFFELSVGRLLFVGGRFKPRRKLVKHDNYQLRETHWALSDWKIPKLRMACHLSGCSWDARSCLLLRENPALLERESCALDSQSLFHFIICVVLGVLLRSQYWNF